MVRYSACDITPADSFCAALLQMTARMLGSTPGFCSGGGRLIVVTYLAEIKKSLSRAPLF